MSASFRQSLVTSISSISARVERALGEIVGPTTCAACDAGVMPLTLFCPPCAASVEVARAIERRGIATRPVFQYGGAVAAAIMRLKYADRSDLGPRLGAWMAGRAAKLIAPDVVVPVPLHPKRLAARGYNQSLLLAVPIARQLGVTLAPRLLSRTRDTSHQTELDRSARWENVRGVFVARERVPRSVILVDDVRTTGATIDSCARALIEEGASHVVALVFAARDT